MSEVKTCEQYVLALLEDANAEIERLKDENARLRDAQFDAVDVECTSADDGSVDVQEGGRDAVMERHCLEIGRMEAAKCAMDHSVHTSPLTDDGSEKPLWKWALENIDSGKIPDGVSADTFFCYLAPQFYILYKSELDRVNSMLPTWRGHVDR